MNTDFCTINYLKSGNEKQKRAHRTLSSHAIMEKLKSFDPILVGTIPICIDIENSDLDIICYANNLPAFKQSIETLFGNEKELKIWERTERNGQAVVANFIADNFIIEIFGQAIPSKQQNAYRHMLIEHQLLVENGEEFRQDIIKLKQEGYKTEPAFAVLLGLKGDPYKALLEYKFS